MRLENPAKTRTKNQKAQSPKKTEKARTVRTLVRSLVHQLVNLQPPVEGLTQTGITEKMLKGCDPPTLFLALSLFPLQTIELFTGVL